MGRSDKQDKHIWLWQRLAPHMRVAVGGEGYSVTSEQMKFRQAHYSTHVTSRKLTP